MTSSTQASKIAELHADGWSNAPSKTPPIKRPLGGPMLLVRGLKFVVVGADGVMRDATKQEIAE